MKHSKSQLMRDIYCHEYLVEQEDLIIRIIPIERVGHTWSFNECLVIDYAHKKETVYETYAEANRAFFDRTKETYYTYPVSIVELANQKIIINK